MFGWKPMVKLLNFPVFLCLLVMSGDIALYNPCASWFTPQIKPSKSHNLYEVMPIIGSLGSLGSKESPGDDLSARQRECDDAPRRAAKELRWQAWSTAFKWQRRISCVGSSSMYACYLRIGMKKHTPHGFLWFVHVVKRCLDLTKCWRNASFIESTVELITSAKWYAPTSKTGSTAMGDLTIFDDLQTNFPAMTSFVGLFVHYFWTSVLWGSTHIYPFRSFKTWLSWVRQCLSATLLQWSPILDFSTGFKSATMLVSFRPWAQTEGCSLCRAWKRKASGNTPAIPKGNFNPLNFQVQVIYFLGVYVDVQVTIISILPKKTFEPYFQWIIRIY